MKSLKFVIPVLLLAFLMISCKNDMQFDDAESPKLAVLFEKESYSLTSKRDLNDFIKASVGVNSKIKVENPSFKEANDELGKFYLVRGQVIENDKVTSVAISLSYDNKSNNKVNDDEIFMLSVDCTMTCTAGTGCTSCKQTIETRCESQTCECTSQGPSGVTCTGSISFGDPEQ